MQLQPASSASSANTISRSTVKMPSRGMETRTGRSNVPIGKVGFVESATCSIHRTRSSTSATLFSVPRGTPLAVVTTSGSWYGVLMVDGSTGWISSSDLKISDLRVMSDSLTPGGSSSNLIQQAMTFIGTPYVWGGASRGGTDCSGFVKQVWSQFGRSLPRTAREQALVGTPVMPESLEAGDRLYFSCKGGAVDHTGIFVGNGMFIHASASRGGVALEQLDTPKYRNAFVGARRG